MISFAGRVAHTKDTKVHNGKKAPPKPSFESFVTVV
jgi:hypothetical protein